MFQVHNQPSYHFIIQFGLPSYTYNHSKSHNYNMITKYTFLFWTSWTITAVMACLSIAFLVISSIITPFSPEIKDFSNVNLNYSFELKSAQIAADIVGSGTKNQLIKNQTILLDQKFYIARDQNENTIILISEYDFRDVSNTKINIRAAQSKLNSEEIFTVSQLASDEIQSEERLDIFFHITNMELTRNWIISAIIATAMAIISIAISITLPKNV